MFRVLMAPAEKNLRTGILLAALLAASAAAHAQFVTPGPNLVTDGIPAIPRALADRLHAYSEFMPQRALSWHPQKRELLISRRAGDASQVFRLEAPGAKPEQYTSFADPVSRASYPPRPGRPFRVRQGRGRQRALPAVALRRRGAQDHAPHRSREAPFVSGMVGRRATNCLHSRRGRSAARLARREVEVRAMDPLDPASDRLVAALPGPGWYLYDWSEDGKTLALGEYVSAVESYLWLLDAQSGDKHALTPDRRERAAHSGAAFSPDGRTLYTTTDRSSEFRRLVAIDVATREARILSDRPWDVEDFDLASDGTKLAFSTNEDGESRLHIIDPRSGKALPVPELPKGVISGLAWNRQGSELAFNFASAKEPAGAYSLDVARSRVVRWTVPETAGADPATFVEPELVRWKSFDGRSISGYLYRPPGPVQPAAARSWSRSTAARGQARPGFYGRYNYFVNELGIALLLPNVRGSTGYGKTFLGLDDGMKREDSVRDIQAALDWIATDPALDARRVLVSGGSYGGYMSLPPRRCIPSGSPARSTWSASPTSSRS
jgi:dipeptidyl aminopeptidase/acylaminoacyl peptidase